METSNSTVAASPGPQPRARARTPGQDNEELGAARLCVCVRVRVCGSGGFPRTGPSPAFLSHTYHYQFKPLPHPRKMSCRRITPTGTNCGEHQNCLDISIICMPDSRVMARRRVLGKRGSPNCQSLDIQMLTAAPDQDHTILGRIN